MYAVLYSKACADHTLYSIVCADCALYNPVCAVLAPLVRGRFWGRSWCSSCRRRGASPSSFPWGGPTRWAPGELYTYCSVLQNSTVRVGHVYMHCTCVFVLHTCAPYCTVPLRGMCSGATLRPFGRLRLRWRVAWQQGHPQSTTLSWRAAGACSLACPSIFFSLAIALSRGLYAQKILVTACQDFHISFIFALFFLFFFFPSFTPSVQWRDHCGAGAGEPPEQPQGQGKAWRAPPFSPLALLGTASPFWNLLPSSLAPCWLAPVDSLAQ